MRSECTLALAAAGDIAFQAVTKRVKTRTENRGWRMRRNLGNCPALRNTFFNADCINGDDAQRMEFQ